MQPPQAELGELSNGRYTLVLCVRPASYEEAKAYMAGNIP